ncbi:sugar transferase [Gimesia fumaroli]|uniref:Undecaprenyl-phosphate N-acetylgalactosaminyl 1-phosphate transferase n=1 Tax=Gimesia fumaroli TaxID=2527976 RepID=A0A518ID30_9PLAN|nr:sugar transferase [Gimesia fumaroli]QDV51012.1 Putative undecaprenyl-phosphate N-acetylgalactosaminyl 1-phosphate transferase [Gimesia fumaroli]
MRNKVPPVVSISSSKAAPLVGMGVVVDASHVITCAHIINYALDRDADDQSRPNAKICVRFILDAQEPVAWATILKWLPPLDSGDNEDVVLLGLDAPTSVDIDHSQFSIPRINEPIRAYGLPQGSTLGIWWSGLVSLPVRSNRFQLEQNENASTILEPGFSGTPLLSINGQKMYGIVARVRGKVGYMIPSQELNRIFKVMPSAQSDGEAESEMEEPLVSQPQDNRTTLTMVATDTEQQGALIEVEVNADYGDFSDEDTFYYQQLIEFMQGFPGVILKVSYIRKGSTIIGFRVISEKADDAASTIVSVINEGTLAEHGVVRASIPSPETQQNFTTGVQVSRYLRWKGPFDQILAAILLVLLAPLIIIGILAVRLTSPGPALFRQTRVGKDGRNFTMYKLRTMHADAEAATGPVWAIQRDPRVTSVGYFLRRTSLDELPQLFNVLRGEMSLVGPSPERPEFIDVFCKSIPDYETRTRIKPGIVGLASSYLPWVMGLEEIRNKFLIDRFYIEHATLWMDVLICLENLARIFFIPIRLTTHYVKPILPSYSKPGEDKNQ